MKKKYDKYFIVRIVIFCALFAIMFSISALLCSRYINSKEAEHKIESSNDFSKSCERIDYYITAIKSINEILFQDENIKKYASEKYRGYNHMDFENITNLSTKLATYQSSFMYMDFFISVSKSLDDMMIINSKTFNLENGISYLNLDADVFKKHLARSEAGTYYDIIINSQNSGNISFVCNKVYSEDSFVYIIYTFKDEGFLTNIKNAFVMFNDTGIVSNNRSLGAKETKKLEDALKRCNSFDKQKVVNELKKTNFNSLVYETDGVCASTYVYLYPDYCRYNLFLYLVLALLSAAFSYWAVPRVFKLIYMPLIRNLKLFSDGEKIEVDYITAFENKVNELLLNQTNHMEFVKNTKNRIKNSYLLELMNGILSKEKYAEFIEEFGLEYMNSSLRCIAFSISNGDSEDYLSDKKDVAEFKESIQSCIQNFFEDNFAGEIIISESNTWFGIVCSVPDIKTKFSSLIDKINDIIEITITIAIGREVANGFKISESYFDVIEILEQNSFGEESGVFEENGTQHEAHVYYPVIIEQSIIEHITRLDFEKAKNMLSTLISRNLDRFGQNRKIVSNFEFAVIQTIQRVLYRLNLDEEEVFPNGTVVYLELKMCKTSEEKEAKILQLFDCIFDYVTKTRLDNGENRYGKSILSYIDENYTKDISLADISASLKISTSLICSIMKERYNTTFKNYINQKRINSACELMTQNPTIKINQLAAEVGYNNATTFTRLFKKYKGVTPGEYMKDKI